MTDDSERDTVGPELTQEDLDRAGEKMDGLSDRYETGARETVVVPGTGGMVSGTAFADPPQKDQGDGDRGDGDQGDGGQPT